jgi:DNA primase large subunit
MTVSHSSTFPWLYLTTINQPPEITIDIAQWEKYGELRAKFLSEFQQLRESKPSQKAFTDLIEKFYGYPPKIESFEEMFIGHLYLRLAASINPRLESWLRETEGDVFEHFFRQLSTDDDKLNAIQVLLGSPSLADNANNIIQKVSLSNKEIENYGLISIKEKGWAIKYTELPDIIAKKLSLTPRKKYSDKNQSSRYSSWKKNPNILLYGYIFAFPSFFFGPMKKVFEKKMADEVHNIKSENKLDSEIERVVKKFVLNLSKDIKFLSTSRSTSYTSSVLVSDTILFPKIDLYPPCMKYLRSKLEETGHIPHLHRLQLGIFLKSLGMDVDTQLRYWYETAIDNVNITYETFNRRAGYQIRYIYGLEGGRKDYSVPKCQTIISDYFCLFQNMNSKALSNTMKSLFNTDDNDKKMNQIFIELENYRPRHACSALLQSLTNERKFISHPLTWVKELMKNQEKKG